MLDLLSKRDLSVSELLLHFRFSQPALSKHLLGLRESGPVDVIFAGRRRIYQLRPEGLRRVADWLQPSEQAVASAVKTTW